MSKPSSVQIGVQKITNLELTPMTDTREAIQAVGEISTDFRKSGPKSSNHLGETKTTISEVALSIVISVEEATASYE